MNAFLAATVLISSVFMLVRVSGGVVPAYGCLANALNTATVGFEKIMALNDTHEKLKEALDGGVEVPDQVLKEFYHVIYYTTDKEGEIQEFKEWDGGDLKFLRSIPAEDTLNAKEASINALGNFVSKFLHSDTFKYLRGEKKEISACIESGGGGMGNDGFFVNHVVAFRVEGAEERVDADKALITALNVQQLAKTGELSTKLLQQLKNAVDGAVSVPVEIVKDFATVIYYTTNADGLIDENSFKTISNEDLEFVVGKNVQNSRLEAKRVFVTSLDSFLQRAEVQRIIDLLKKVNGKVGACAESGGSRLAEGGIFYNHVVAFTEDDIEDEAGPTLHN